MKQLLASLAIMFLSTDLLFADRISITLTPASAVIRPIPCSCALDFRYGWFHLERSTNLLDPASWETIDYCYGSWSDFKLTDNKLPSELGFYRVVFFEVPE